MMKRTARTVIGPRWANAEHTRINMVTLFEELAEQYGPIPFTASPDDTEEHGRDLFERALAGEFGEIAEYEPPAVEVIARQVQGQRDRLLAAAALRIAPLQDAIDLGVATEQQRERLNAWKRFRIALSELEQDAGWPRVLAWPAPPEVDHAPE